MLQYIILGLRYMSKFIKNCISGAMGNR